ncbi:hypothetical protein L2E82_17156 [Cichorium intybus]|uniref:Uncharacterized protein n=1 Tax=Cichorium intybus TaxID=13427 RepID=A0ACB9F8G7_CICIN|nr:hypothetical protein L2E82_17156 [Cichorium intybus]
MRDGIVVQGLIEEDMSIGVEDGVGDCEDVLEGCSKKSEQPQSAMAVFKDGMPSAVADVACDSVGRKIRRGKLESLCVRVYESYEVKRM